GLSVSLPPLGVGRAPPAYLRASPGDLSRWRSCRLGGRRRRRPDARLCTTEPGPVFGVTRRAPRVTLAESRGVYMTMMKRPLVVVLALIVGVGLAGCGGGHGVKVVGHTIEIGQDVSETFLMRSVLGIKVGTPASGVRTRLGAPFAKVGSGHQTCWV